MAQVQGEYTAQYKDLEVGKGKKPLREEEEGEEGDEEAVGPTSEAVPRMREMADTHILVAIMVATLAIPGGYSVYSLYSAYKNPSHARKVALHGFYGSNGLAIVLSIMAVLVYFFLPFRKNRRFGTKAHFTLATALAVASIAALVVSFITASLAILPLTGGHIAVVATSSFCILYLVIVWYYYLC